MKKRRTARIVGAIVLLALIAAAIWQRNNLEAAWILLTKNSEEISAQLDDKRQAMQKEIEEQTGVALQVPTPQQRDEVLSGQKTAEELREELGLNEPSTASGVGERPTGTQTGTKNDPVRQAEIIRACSSEMLTCEIDVMARLSALKDAALDEWEALPEAERTSARKKKIAAEGLKQCYRLETEVDAQVRAIIAKYKTELTAVGGDTSVLDTLWRYYESEKATQKAYYTDQYLR
ncbi:MAG: hypothetical protein IKQ87_05235 [Clostridia bacterium]|nr:hypothetical protein [Oscillibacter sp.]MBR4185151.1 hypothetical protein [Clostridia bacterium]